MIRIALLLAMVRTAHADEQHLRSLTDIVAFEKPVTEQQCIDAGKKAIAAAGFAPLVVEHAAAGQKKGDTLWFVSVDCLQRRWNATYIVVTSSETNSKTFETTAQAIVRAETALGGKSELGIK